MSYNKFGAQCIALVFSQSVEGVCYMLTANIHGLETRCGHELIKLPLSQRSLCRAATEGGWPFRSTQNSHHGDEFISIPGQFSEGDGLMDIALPWKNEVEIIQNYSFCLDQPLQYTCMISSHLMHYTVRPWWLNSWVGYELVLKFEDVLYSLIVNWMGVVYCCLSIVTLSIGPWLFWS